MSEVENVGHASHVGHAKDGPKFPAERGNRRDFSHVGHASYVGHAKEEFEEKAGEEDHDN